MGSFLVVTNIKLRKVFHREFSTDISPTIFRISQENCLATLWNLGFSITLFQRTRKLETLSMRGSTDPIICHILRYPIQLPLKVSLLVKKLADFKDLNKYVSNILVVQLYKTVANDKFLLFVSDLEQCSYICTTYSNIYYSRILCAIAEPSLCKCHHTPMNTRSGKYHVHSLFRISKQRKTSKFINHVVL